MQAATSSLTGFYCFFYIAPTIAAKVLHAIIVKVLHAHKKARGVQIHWFCGEGRLRSPEYTYNNGSLCFEIR